MTPPEAPDSNAGKTPPAVSVCPRVKLEIIRTRPDFLAAARAARQGTAPITASTMPAALAMCATISPSNR